MLPDRVSNPGPLTYESGALPIALRVPATSYVYQPTYHPTYGADGAGRLSVPGVLLILILVGHWAFSAFTWCGWGLFGYFSVRRPDKD